MYKRAISFTFLILANLILLAHVIIPHHHHTMQVCLDSSHCQDDDDHHDAQGKHNDHQHDGRDKSPCVLNQIVIIPANNIKKEKLAYTSIGDDFSADNVQFCFNNTDFNFNIRSSLHFVNYQAVCPVIFPPLTSHSLGLRAPPAV